MRSRTEDNNAVDVRFLRRRCLRRRLLRPHDSDRRRNKFAHFDERRKNITVIVVRDTRGSEREGERDAEAGGIRTRPDTRLNYRVLLGRGKLTNISV